MVSGSKFWREEWFIGHAAENVYLQAVAMNLGTMGFGVSDDVAT